MNYILFDDHSWKSLLPLTSTRPVANIRIGILTIKEKWELFLNSTCSFLTRDYLSEKFRLSEGENNILINSSVLPDKDLVEEITTLKINEALFQDKDIVAVFFPGEDVKEFDCRKTDSFIKKQYNSAILKIQNPWDIFEYNGEAIRNDFLEITKNRSSEPFSQTVQVFNKKDVFIEEGARIECAALNATKGPIYIGKNAEVMEGSTIYGPFSLGENAIVKIGTKIYGPTTVGPYSKVAGEINNSVIFGYSNKAHDGYLGSSVIGEWCNIGAGTNISNLKNNYSEVRVWNYEKEEFVNTGLQFCGLFMADHSKCGINSMFNTGTVVGVSANIFGAGFPRQFIPSFSWGGAHGYTTYKIQKAIEVAKTVKSRRDLELDSEEIKILEHIYEITQKFRKF